MFGMSSSTANITILTPVVTNHTGMRGRPRKNVDPNVLHEAFKANRRIPKTVLANVLGIDRNTLNTRLKELNIDSGFSDISDPELDAHVQEYWQENPAGGRAYVIGCLRAASLRIQRERVVDSMNRVDRLGQGMRKQVGKKKKHKRYHVPRPNSLWHIDGHHKLIAWGIVIHGIADGYSRKANKLLFTSCSSVIDVFLGHRAACKHQ
jgi:hypothetical protein